MKFQAKLTFRRSFRCGGVETVFKTEVRQSLSELNKWVQESKGEGKLITVTPKNVWNYSTLNNFNNNDRIYYKNEVTPLIENRNFLKIKDYLNDMNSLVHIRKRREHVCMIK
jgi:hypothetical protein